MATESSSPSPAVVLVTGSGRGLGRGIALELAAAGHSVCVNYAARRPDAEATVSDCQELARSADQRFIAVQADIANAEDRTRLLRETLEGFGRIDALVNNAGIAPRTRTDLLETTVASFEELVRVNAQGPHFLTQAVARHWLGQDGPSALPGGYAVIFISSISASTASVQRGEYCVSKAALAMSAQLWASRLAGSGIQVVELRPGIMATDMTAAVKDKYDALIAEGVVPQRRWGTPDDVGRAVRAILAGDFPYSSGAVIPIDGGLHLRRL
jgi:NAD(P)-dependent dehydrogenase (short-subunit alcohol dehydrogenase family)